MATIRKFIKRQHGTEPNKLVSRQRPANRNPSPNPWFLQPPTAPLFFQTPRRLPGTQQTVKINKASLPCLDFFLVSGFRQQNYTLKKYQSVAAMFSDA